MRSSGYEGNAEWDTGDASRELELLQQNQALRRENEELQTEVKDLTQLVEDYETVLEKVLEGLRIYAVCPPAPACS